MRKLIAAGAMAAATLTAAAAAAGGPAGDLDEGDCVSGELASDGPCELIPAAAADGNGSGLNAVESVTVSRNGRFVYAAARADASIARFRRRGDGSLLYLGCVSGNSDSSCAAIRRARSGGVGSGLQDVRALVLSRDGDSAYAAVAGADAVARFRVGREGKLRYRGCIGGDSDAACREIRHATPGGADSGLDHPKSLTLSRNGKSLYVAATNDAAIVRFRRNRKTGALRFGGCITGESGSGPAGSRACRQIPEANGQGDDTGLDDARGLALSPDSRWLYGVSSDDDAVFKFKRNRRSGRLAFRGCTTGESESVPACAPVVGVSPAGANSGFDDLRALTITHDGRSVYVTSRGDDAVVEFRRNLRKGTLTYKRCLSGDLDSAAGEPCDSVPVTATNGEDSGMDGAEGVVASRDGRSVYISGSNDASVVEFTRSPATGALTFKFCDSGDYETGHFVGTAACSELSLSTAEGDNSGIGFPQFMALSRDDRSLYVAAAGDDSVFHFARER